MKDFFPVKQLRNARFRLSTPDSKQFPLDEGFEVAFAGRSNVGKSSTLNAIVDQKGLAKTSGQPGRTQHIVFFDVDAERRLVDLPGYGYAKAGYDQQREWGKLVNQYMESRQCLRGLVLVTDIRRPFSADDEMLLEWVAHRGVSLHLVLNKADKLSRRAAESTLLAIKDQGLGSVQLFSALKKDGVAEVHRVLGGWLDMVVEEQEVPNEKSIEP